MAAETLRGSGQRPARHDRARSGAGVVSRTWHGLKGLQEGRWQTKAGMRKADEPPSAMDGSQQRSTRKKAETGLDARCAEGERREASLCCDCPLEFWMRGRGGGCSMFHLTVATLVV